MIQRKFCFYLLSLLSEVVTKLKWEINPCCCRHQLNFLYRHWDMWKLLCALLGFHSVNLRNVQFNQYVPIVLCLRFYRAYHATNTNQVCLIFVKLLGLSSRRLCLQSIRALDVYTSVHLEIVLISSLWHVIYWAMVKMWLSAASIQLYSCLNSEKFICWLGFVAHRPICWHFCNRWCCCEWAGDKSQSYVHVWTWLMMWTDF